MCQPCSSSIQWVLQSQPKKYVYIYSTGAGERSTLTHTFMYNRKCDVCMMFIILHWALVKIVKHGSLLSLSTLNAVSYGWNFCCNALKFIFVFLETSTCYIKFVVKNFFSNDLELRNCVKDFHHDISEIIKWKLCALFDGNEIKFLSTFIVLILNIFPQSKVCGN